MSPLPWVATSVDANAWPMLGSIIWVVTPTISVSTRKSVARRLTIAIPKTYVPEAAQSTGLSMDRAVAG
jgi:hypothetical protein